MSRSGRPGGTGDRPPRSLRSRPEGAGQSLGTALRDNGPFAPLNPPLPAWPAARVWIIGASTGIGAATANALLAQGARVALSARSADKLADVAGNARPRWCCRSTLPTPPPSRRVAPPAREWQGVDLVLMVAGTHQEIRAWEVTEQKRRR